MTDDELRTALSELGVSSDTARALLLLPLIQVAWTDGEIQPSERTVVLELASRAGLDGPGIGLVESWLSKRPSSVSFVRARTALVELARRGGVEHGELDDIVASCEAVAAAAGGVFGLAFTVSGAERSVIAEIAEVLVAGPLPELDLDPDDDDDDA